MTTTRTHAARLAALAAGLGLLTGCGGGPKLARVSGTVTLDGKPLPNAMVSFQPIGDKDNQNPGGGSLGVTDTAGRYVLLYEGHTQGAVVGTHRVRISSLPGKGAGDKPPSDLGSEDGVILPKGVKAQMDYDLVPTEWNENSTKTFEVPAAGTDKADFAITSPKPPAKGGGKKK